MALEILGKPVPNTALLSAFLALTGLLPQAALIHALAGRFRGEVLERNSQLVKQAAARVDAGAWQEASLAARN
jgi:pyruvate ferredoxin oxidoreductase gamma subunit